MPESEAIKVEAFYRYGYRGHDMIAIRSPFAVSADSEMIGRRILVGEKEHRIVAVRRQISGPIQKGEPIGVEIDNRGSVRDSVVRSPGE
ncbi:hypothetical protein [Methylocystis parvus]|uniref:Uncharacterized protein n=1 Tax=Methylocystis parvus TaxID=134 RepID=A0A6B8M5A8_9HYPH|nr:hypothetical protein [Methylocystis parvus]QGM97598.1 hypothetical protein F7D14_09085 [Methylocystis parvus]WBJ98469.1 hypothetical protein MMG94_10510 [Methylocystis parvus OBBP]